MLYPLILTVVSLLFFASSTLGANLVLDRPLRAQPASLSELRRVEGSLGVEYFKTNPLPDSMGSPATLKWTVMQDFQLRIATVGFIGEAFTYTTLSELHDIKLGAQYQFLHLPLVPIDAAIRGYVVGVDSRKQRYILTTLLSTTWLGSSWDANIELSVPLQPNAPPLQGTIAVGQKWPFTINWGFGIGYVMELPEKRTTRHFGQLGIWYHLSPDWVIDLGSQTELGGSGTNYSIFGGVSFFIGPM